MLVTTADMLQAETTFIIAATATMIIVRTAPLTAAAAMKPAA
jgi:hypothetical protein